MSEEMLNISNPEEGVIKLERWSTENFFFALLFVASLIIWILLTVSIIGMLYAVMLGLFFFFSHMSFIAYVRGSAVKVTPHQFPDLFGRIQQLSKKAGMRKAPDTYIMQSGGDLNAFATKFTKSHIVVLYADLLDACEHDPLTRDMIIGHEFGHIKAGHLRWLWFLLPGMMIPFIGAAYSRCREYTCDRFGAALCQDKRAAVKGMVLLAVGKKYMNDVNIEEFIKQKKDLNSGLMKIGLWMSTYPALSERMTAIDRDLQTIAPSTRQGVFSGLVILILLFLIPSAGFLALRPHLKAIFSANTTGQETQNYLNENELGETTDLFGENETFIKDLKSERLKAE